jgi:hypothetical protein
MDFVLCELCETKVSPLTCWCVIDTREKTRHYECKDTRSCKPKVKAPESAPVLAPASLEPAPFEIEIPDDVIIRTETVPEWAEAYPRPTWFQRIRQWFSTPAGYTKVKTN